MKISKALSFFFALSLRISKEALSTEVESFEPYYPLYLFILELELELIQTQMAQKPMLREEVGMRVRCANKASAE